jgi:hypothetical protein
MKYPRTLIALGAFAALGATLSADEQKPNIPKVGDTTKRKFATIDAFQKLCGVRENQEVEVFGIAGYTDDKGSDPCIWLLKEGIVVLVLIDRWPDHLLGQRIQVFGKVTRIPKMPLDVGVRHLAPGHFILTRVHLKDGKLLYDEEAEIRKYNKIEK